MRVTMFWHGGSGYAPPSVHSAEDAEVFESIKDAKAAFARRTRDAYYPCVCHAPPEEDGPEAWLFFSRYGETHPIIGHEYPDQIMRLGKRGAVVIENA